MTINATTAADTEAAIRIVGETDALPFWPPVPVSVTNPPEPVLGGVTADGEVVKTTSAIGATVGTLVVGLQVVVVLIDATGFVVGFLVGR